MVILFTLGALGVDGLVTPMGRRMCSFPLDPLQSRTIIESTKHSSTSSLLSVLALLSTSGKIFFDSKDRDVSSEARLKFRHRSGDHMTLLNALRAYEEVLASAHDKKKMVIMDSNGKSASAHSVKEWCKANFLNDRALKEALDIRKQLRECCEREKIEWKMKETEEKEEEGVLKSLLSGFWQNTALIQPDGTYRQVIGREVSVHGLPGTTRY